MFRARPFLSVAAVLYLVVAVRADEIVFASYNLENYQRQENHQTGKRDAAAIKTEDAVAALIAIIKEIHPDILGVCEMGSRADFEDFKTHLRDSGLDYPDSEYVEAADPDRHLALLSRFPIKARNSQTDVAFAIDGRAEKVRRGFLDVTVAINPGTRLRLIGAHLKSKREVAEGQALLRRQEAHLLRAHLDSILAADDKAPLLVYGDFNDTKNEPPIREIMGPKKSAHFLTDLWLKDNVGDRWTQYWKTADLYSRIDYIFVNRVLLPDIVMPKCRIQRSEPGNLASDHRPIIATIRVAK